MPEITKDNLDAILDEAGKYHEELIDLTHKLHWIHKGYLVTSRSIKEKDWAVEEAKIDTNCSKISDLLNQVNQALKKPDQELTAQYQKRN
ncbi:MAG: hypothetical protein PSV35_04640, partial [bacterium]|nr:hypothetical protein [bacterium]